MNQRDFETRLQCFADGELHGPDRAAFEVELAARPADRARVEQSRALRTAVRRTIDETPLPARLSDRLRTRLAAARERTTQRFALRTAIAAAILLLAVGPRWGGPIEVEAWRFTRTYELCARDQSHNEWEYIPAVGQEVSVGGRYKIAIPDLRPLGFEVEGVCHCRMNCPEFQAVHIHYHRAPTAPGAPEIHLSLFPIDRPISLQSRTAVVVDSATRRAYEFTVSDSVHVLHWRDLRGSVALCAELPDAQIQGIAGDIHFAHATGISLEALAALLIPVE